jgi:hypothetical protein
MVRLFVGILLLGTAVLVAGCAVPWVGTVFVQGSGNLESRTFDFSDFTEVEGQGTFRVVIAQGDEYAVEVSADDNAWEQLDVRQVGERVIFGTRGIVTFNDVTLEATVTMPTLEEFHLSGAYVGRFNGFDSGEDFRALLSGASRIEGDLEAGNINLELSGASRATIVGSGENLTLNASGASQADLEELAVVDATVELSGASRAVVAPAGTLNVEASGASNLQYVGSPRMGAINTSGASNVTQR